MAVKGAPQDCLEAGLFEGAGTTRDDRGRSLKELLLTPEARTERLTPPRRRWRWRKPWLPD